MHFDRLNICPLNTDITAINRLPNEILTIILKFHIHNYFSHYRHLYERPPSPLQVCRRWRQLAISTPSCWSYLKIHIDTRAKMKPARRNVSVRDTKPKAMQDALNCYFKWAKDCPVDLSIKFGCHFNKGAKDALIRWIGTNMPRLRCYRETAYFGLFLNILPALSEDRYSELTDLEIGVPGYTCKVVQRISMPKLRVFRLPGYNPNRYDLINHHFDFPNLKALYLGYAYPKLIVTALEHFPLLTELASRIVVEATRLNNEIAAYRPKANVLRRVMLRGTNLGMMSYFPIIRPWFAQVRDWSINSIFVKRLNERQTTEDFIVGGAKILSIHCHPDTTSTGIQLNNFWNYFPDIVHLTLVGGGHYEFTFTEEKEPDTEPTDMSWSIMGNLINSLILRSEENHVFNHCPKLKSLEVLNLDLSLNALTLLLDILQQRSSETGSSGNEDAVFRLTIKRSIYSYSENSLPIDEHGMSYSVFKSFVDDLRAKTDAAICYRLELGKSIIRPKSPKALFR